MKEDITKSESLDKNQKGRFWRNIWLISILTFIASFLIMTTFSALGGLIFLLSLLAGVTSFLVWIFRFGNKIIKFIIGGIIILAILFVFILVVVIKPTVIYGDSMNPAFKNGEYLLIDKLTYRFRSPKRGEVIDYTKDDGEYIGRIVGLPNETISLKVNELGVNGKVISEPYADWTKWAENREIELTLKENEYLILYDKRGGDNQIVKRENLIGKFFYRYWPLSASGFVKY